MDPQQAPQAPQPQQPITNPVPPSYPNVPPVAPQVPTSMQPTAAIPLRKGLAITLMLVNLVFFIPSMWAVIIFYNRYTKAARTGDTVAAAKSLKAMKLWGFIGMAIGIPLFILYLVANSTKS